VLLSGPKPGKERKERRVVHGPRLEESPRSFEQKRSRKGFFAFSQTRVRVWRIYVLFAQMEETQRTAENILDPAGIVNVLDFPVRDKVMVAIR